MTNIKLYIPVLTLSAQDDLKLLQRLNQDLKEQLTGINTNNNKLAEAQNWYLDQLISPSFKSKRLFVLSFENEDDWTSYTGYYLPKV